MTYLVILSVICSSRVLSFNLLFCSVQFFFHSLVIMPRKKKIKEMLTKRYIDCKHTKICPIIRWQLVNLVAAPCTPQVRLKMNDKKPSRFQFYFSGVLEAFSKLRKIKKKNASLNFRDNPIYPISNPDGQDQEV